MRKTLLTTTLACLMLMTACSANETKTNEGETTTKTQTETVTETQTDSLEADNEERVEAYLDLVEKMSAKSCNVYGEPIDRLFDDDTMNLFAINDIDGDGKLELIVSWDDAAYVYTWGGVYEYDVDKDEFIDEGLSSMLLTFYDNGVAYLPWYHNQGYGEMTPYDAYKYDESTDSYKQVLSADSWDKDIEPTDYPDNVDVENAGTVYFVGLNGNSIDYENPISKSEYEKIYNQVFENSNPVELDFYYMSLDGVSSYKSEN